MIPQNVNSHLIYFSRLAKGLKEEGHNITVIAPSNSKVPDWLEESGDILRYQVDGDYPFANSPQCSEMMIKSAMTDSIIEKTRIFGEIGALFHQHWSDDCEKALNDKKLMTRISGTKFDFAVVDGSAINCLVVLPYKLDIPYAMYSLPYFPWLYRIPSLPSFVPNLQSDYSDSMTFKQRLVNVLMEASTLMFINTTTYYSEKYAPEKPVRHVLDFLSGASLWLLISDVSTSYPAPSMPNTVNIGDIMAVSANPLPTNLDEVVTGSDNGVIVVSMGSLFVHIPDEIVAKFCAAFGRVSQTVIWKLINPPSCELPSNVKVLPWIPQNDLLGNSAVKLFITHAGMNSMIEAINHGVPTISFPVALDQTFNAAYLGSRGMGIQMSLKTFTSDELATNIETIISQESYKSTTKHYSALMTDKLDSPSRRASFWINHVLKHGESHLRTSAYDLSHIQFFMIDIFAFCVLILFLALTLGSIILCYLIHFCKRNCVKSAKLKTN